MHICTVTVQCVNNFLFFFSLSSIKPQQTSVARKKTIPAPVPPPPPNYNKPNNQTQRHHQTLQPSTEKYPKINRNPKINPTQKQYTPTGKPSPTEPDLSPDLLPLLPPDLPLLSSVGGRRRRVGCGGEREDESTGG